MIRQTAALSCHPEHIDHGIGTNGVDWTLSRKPGPTMTANHIRPMHRWMPAGLFLAILGGVLWAQKPAPIVRSVRLYVFDCGHLKSGNPDPLLQRGITTTDMSVAAFLIVHPRGTLLWDSGVIPDELIQPGGTTEARATVRTTIKGQLAEIGYKPSDITYLALSHNHYDHSANANEFAGSTWLVQRPERAAMFPDTPPATPNNAAARFSGLKTSKTMILDGDYDVFGDGTVIIISTPGHTPGHQSLFVKLKKTGGWYSAATCITIRPSAR